MDPKNFSDGVWPAFLSAAVLVAAHVYPGPHLSPRPSNFRGDHRAERFPDYQRLSLDLEMVPAAAETAEGLRDRLTDFGHAARERTEVPAVDDRVQRVGGAARGLEEPDAHPCSARPAGRGRMEMD